MKTTQIIPTRLAVLERLTLLHGSHGAPPKKLRDEPGALKLCALEAVAWLADEPWSDQPKCACPVIASFCRSWNDAIQDDARRTALILPLVPLLVGTRSTPDVEGRRSWMACDWEMRVRVPAFLRLLPATEGEAAALEALPEIVDIATLGAAGEIASAAQAKAHAARAAAWDAARAAAWDAARAAAWDAARAAAWDAARAAAGDAAWAAAWAAARDAARDAAWAKLRPTVEACQASAQDLVRRMCAVQP